MDKLTNVTSKKPSGRCKKSAALSRDQPLINELIEYRGVSNMRRLIKKYEKTKDEIV